MNLSKMTIPKVAIPLSALAICGLTLIAPIAHAGARDAETRDAGTRDGGGGHAVGKELFDFYETQGQSPVNFAKDEFPTFLLPAIQDVRERLTKIEGKVPVLALMLRNVLETKKWFLVSHDIECADTSSMVKAARISVACQDREVLLFEPWLKTVGVFQQSGLIFHEMVRALKADGSTKLTSRDEMMIREFVRTIYIELDKTSANELARIARDTGVRPNGVLSQTREEVIAKAHEVLVYLETLNSQNSKLLSCQSLSNDERRALDKIEAPKDAIEVEILVSKYLQEIEGLSPMDVIGFHLFDCINPSRDNKRTLGKRFKSDTISLAIQGVRTLINDLSSNF